MIRITKRLIMKSENYPLTCLTSGASQNGIGFRHPERKLFSHGVLRTIELFHHDILPLNIGWSDKESSQEPVRNQFREVAS
jgi:hypothetical protein